MSNGTYSFVPVDQWIQNLSELGNQTPDYVLGLVEERFNALQNLPSLPRSLLESCTGVIVDVGPGEGVSSMALAQFLPRTEVLGIEMDDRHLRAAWPDCTQYPNLRLAWGTIPGTPSNPQVYSDASLPPSLALPDGFCDVLFSWTGMSRKDVFVSAGQWSRVVKDACVFILPKCWREGLDSLPVDQQDQIRSLCSRLGLSPPSWKASPTIPGFSSIQAFPWKGSKTARGWLLWLTGIFDASAITFWDTLTDRWGSPPKYELPDLELEMEVIVARKLGKENVMGKIEENGTTLNIQRLKILNCEEAIERAYFDWGRGFPKDSQEPDWDTATPEQRRAIALRGYRLYDGCPVPPGNQITPVEVCLSILIGALIVPFDVVRIMVRAEQPDVAQLLAAIPEDVPLEEGTDEQIAKAAELIDAFQGPYIKLGKVTKFLHKKRPAFIPVLDSVVVNFLRKNFPHRLNQNSPTKDMLRLLREILRARRVELEQIRATLAGMGFQLSTVRVLDYLIWIGWNRRQDKPGRPPTVTEVWEDQKFLFRPSTFRLDRRFPTITETWETDTLKEARTKAREAWGS